MVYGIMVDIFTTNKSINHLPSGFDLIALQNELMQLGVVAYSGCNKPPSASNQHYVDMLGLFVLNKIADTCANIIKT